ncbi:MAG: di-heme oxidoredictase family protein [Myxococcaceae bacterium]
MKKTLLALTALLSLTSLAGDDCRPRGDGRAAVIGDPVPGLTPSQLALFNAGKALYQHEFSVAEGLGPIFNRQSCAACHGAPVVGGSDPEGTANNVTHFMINNQGNFMPALEFGGPVIQQRSIESVPGGGGCHLQPEAVPPLPGVTTSHRHTPPVFGFGLLDAVPDAEILAWQGPRQWKDPSVVGAANWGTEMESLVRLQAFTFDITRKQPAGIARVGRFGWKAQTPTIFQFSAEPFNIELGVSSPFFPRENHPQGQALPPECQLAGTQPNDSGSQKSVALYQFQALIGAPPSLPKSPRAKYGEFLFRATGCADCHRASMRTVKDYYLAKADGTAERVDALSDKEIFPYSDLLVHDMGPGLEDGRVMGRAGGRFWRTTPLWGNRFKPRYLHDGRAATIDEAIDLHGGEATRSQQLYEALNPQQEAALLEFINTL